MSRKIYLNVTRACACEYVRARANGRKCTMMAVFDRLGAARAADNYTLFTLLVNVRGGARGLSERHRQKTTYRMRTLRNHATAHVKRFRTLPFSPFRLRPHTKTRPTNTCASVGHIRTRNARAREAPLILRVCVCCSGARTKMCGRIKNIRIALKPATLSPRMRTAQRPNMFFVVNINRRKRKHTRRAHNEVNMRKVTTLLHTRRE